MTKLLAVVVLVLIVAALVIAFAPRSHTNPPVGTPSREIASTAPSSSASPTSSEVAKAEPTATTAPASTSRCTLRGPLPDPVCTPGVADPRVTQANIATTICAPGYTATVRPPTSYTTPLERQLIARYGLALTPQQTELDHLIPLELGGDPRDVRNLFPEPYEPRPGAHEKDVVENRLHADVCAGRISLAEAQRRIATDWTTAR
jgi:hypothetical protein